MYRTLHNNLFASLQNIVVRELIPSFVVSFDGLDGWNAIEFKIKPLRVGE